MCIRVSVYMWNPEADIILPDRSLIYLLGQGLSLPFGTLSHAACSGEIPVSASQWLEIQVAVKLAQILQSSGT